MLMIFIDNFLYWLVHNFNGEEELQNISSEEEHFHNLFFFSLHMKMTTILYYNIFVLKIKHSDCIKRIVFSFSYGIINYYILTLPILIIFYLVFTYLFIF